MRFVTIKACLLSFLSILITVGNAPATEPLDYVDPMIGTTKLGNTFPAVCVPFGLTKWTPQTRAGERKGSKPYDYKDTMLQGIRWTNFFSGSAVPEYGSMTIMATTGTRAVHPEERASRFSHNRETSTPYQYKVYLDDYDITMSCTATSRCGYFRIAVPGGKKVRILLQPNNEPVASHTTGGIAYIEALPSRNEIAGFNPAFRYYISTGQPAGFSGYFVARFDRPADGYGVWDRNGLRANGTVATGQPGAYAEFTCAEDDTIEVVIGCSFTSIDQARRNLDAEIGTSDYASVMAGTRDTWREALGVIEVETERKESLTTFYTAMYHSLMLPREFGDTDGTYPGFARTGVAHADGFTYYDDYSLWDTYRALHPLLLFIQPDRITDMIDSLLAKAESGGWLPIFPGWNSYTTEMIGDHAISMIADAYAKGFTDFDTEKAWSYMYKNASQMPADHAEYEDGKGRRAVEDYMTLGYVPLDNPVDEAFHKKEQVSRTLEYAYDDFCLAEFARLVGKKDKHDELSNRALNWKNVFDPSVGFVRGRYRDGRWDDPFDPGKSMPYITEATPWVYTWYVPHDVQGLIDAMGGRQTFIEKLDTFFAGGFYAHDNEPSHQIAYLYSYAGAPWKTQDRVRRAMADNYDNTPGGLSGNDDAGQMSAWYIMSALGFYPVCPGTTQYIIGSPIFDRVVIHLSGEVYQGKTLEIVAENVSERNRYIQSVTVNGESWDKSWLNHRDLANGGRIVFTMGPDPETTWASAPESAPFSLSTTLAGQ